MLSLFLRLFVVAVYYGVCCCFDSVDCMLFVYCVSLGYFVIIVIYI